MLVPVYSLVSSVKEQQFDGWPYHLRRCLPMPPTCLLWPWQVIEPKVKAFLYTWGEGRYTAEGASNRSARLLKPAWWLLYTWGKGLSSSAQP